MPAPPCGDMRRFPGVVQVLVVAYPGENVHIFEPHIASVFAACRPHILLGIHAAQEGIAHTSACMLWWRDPRYRCACACQCLVGRVFGDPATLFQFACRGFCARPSPQPPLPPSPCPQRAGGPDSTKARGLASRRLLSNSAESPGPQDVGLPYMTHSNHPGDSLFIVCEPYFRMYPVDDVPLELNPQVKALAKMSKARDVAAAQPTPELLDFVAYASWAHAAATGTSSGRPTAQRGRR